MGIPGLLEHLSSVSVLSNEQILKKSTTLLIDSSSILFYLLDNVDSHLFSRQYGGGYDILDSRTRIWMENCRCLQINIIVYFDNGNNYRQRLKYSFNASALDSSDDEWYMLSSKSEHSSPPNQSELPIPVLCFEQLWSTLESMNILIVDSVMEVNQEMAKACIVGNRGCVDGEEMFFCVSDDRFVQ